MLERPLKRTYSFGLTETSTKTSENASSSVRLLISSSISKVCPILRVKSSTLDPLLKPANSLAAPVEDPKVKSGSTGPLSSKLSKSDISGVSSSKP